MSSYDNRFGGSVINPSTISYSSLTLSQAVTQLSWPIVYQDKPNVVSSYISVTSNDDSYSIQMPDATQTSVGQATIIANVGANDFYIQNASGGIVQADITPTQVYFLILTDNSTAAGQWETLLFGATTATANAAELAGFGLTALSNARLNTYRPITEVNSNYLVTLNDRDKMFVWTGGTGTITLPDAAAALNGFMISVNNRSEVGGVLNMTPQAGETIDGAISFSLNIEESSMFISDGQNWISLGYGNNSVSSIDVLELDVSAGGTITLNSVQAQRQVQRFNGTLTADVTIEVPNIPNTYFVSNNTSGDFSFTYKMVGGLTETLIPRSQRMIFVCDTFDIKPSPSFIIGSFGFGNGSAAAPSVTFSSDSETGLYLNTAGNIGASAGGVLRANINQFGVSTVDGTNASPSYSWINNTNTGLYNINNDSIGFSANGTEVAIMENTGLQLIDGLVTDPAFSFIDENAGIYRVGENIIGFTIDNLNVLNITTSGVALKTGNAVTPSLTFQSQATKGLYDGGANIIGVSVNKVEVARFEQTGIKVLSGSAANPSYAFPLDGDSGIFNPSANAVGVSCGGTLTATFKTTGLNLSEGQNYSQGGINQYSLNRIFGR